MRVQYLELRDAHTLQPATGELSQKAVLLIAAHVGRTRLIDNVQLG